MGYSDRHMHVDAAFDEIEATILPGLAAMLDGLIEAASASRRAGAPEATAVEIAVIAADLEALSRQVEAISPPG